MDIVNARIDEIADIILNKNVNINFFKKEDIKIYIIIEDTLISDNFKGNFEFYFSKNYNFSPLLINYFEIDAAIKSAASISMFGWKKEAIPVTETKNSLITRIFKSLFG